MQTLTISKPRVAIDAELRHLLEEQEEKCTIVHCRISSADGNMMRIWPSTFLVQDDGTRKALIKAFNISLMPMWTYYPEGSGNAEFTLVFEGLSGNCRSFHLLEDIPEPGAFFTIEVARNQSDVYRVEVKAG